MFRLETNFVYNLTPCLIKILANISTKIPSESAHITFEQKYTYAYGDDWIIE